MDEAPAIKLATQGAPAVGVIPTVYLHNVDSGRLGKPTSNVPNSFHSPPVEFVLRV